MREPGRSKFARKTNIVAKRERGGWFLLDLKCARERANGVLLSRETTGPNSSVKTALRDSRLLLGKASRISANVSVDGSPYKFQSRRSLANARCT